MSDERLQRDELISAYLDGEATPAEIAEVTSDDTLLARVEQLRAARDAVAAPVAPLSAERRDQMIGAALAVADGEADARREARIVPLRQPQRTILAVAAAALVLGAVVSAGLIASRGDDDASEMAAESLTMAGAAADAPADADMTAAAAEEEPMADEEPMAEFEEAADEPFYDEVAATTTTMTALAAEPMAEEAEMEAPAETAAEPESAPADTSDEGADAATTSGEEERRSDETAEAGEPDGPIEPVVDLGTAESYESLFANLGATWSVALEDGAMADPGPCSEAVNQRALELSTETTRSFVATVGIEDPLTVDARFARRDDGTSFVVYAAPPDCEIAIRELDGS